MENDVVNRIFFTLFGCRICVSRSLLTSLRALSKCFCMVSNKFYYFVRRFLVSRVVEAVTRVVLSQGGSLCEFLVPLYVRRLGPSCVSRGFFLRSFLLSFVCESIWCFSVSVFYIFSALCNEVRLTGSLGFSTESLAWGQCKGSSYTASLLTESDLRDGFLDSDTISCTKFAERASSPVVLQVMSLGEK